MIGVLGLLVKTACADWPVLVPRSFLPLYSPRRGGAFARCKWATILSTCIENHHSQKCAQRKRAECRRIVRNSSRFVRRMVVVSRAKMPAKRASFESRQPLEKKLSGSLADRAGFEPAVAVTPRTLSKRVP